MSDDKDNDAKRSLVNIEGNSVFKVDVGLPGDAINGVSELVCKILGNVALEPSEVLGQIISDQFKAFRILNLHRWKERIQKRGIKVESLPPDFAIPLIESVAEVSDETLQDMWASLLESAVENGENARVSFVRLLKSLDAQDAKVLKLMASEPLRLMSDNDDLILMDNQRIELNDSGKVLTVSIARLESERLCTIRVIEGHERYISAREVWGQLTTLGKRSLAVFGVDVESNCLDEWEVQHMAHKTTKSETVQKADFERTLKKHTKIVGLQ